MDEFETDIDESGNIIVPAAVAEEYGLYPGSRIRIRRNARGLEVRRPITHLRKVYIEPTNQCNLDCVTCIRHSWDEPLGTMNSETFSRIMDGLCAFSPQPDIFLGGLGEPLSHPRIVDMVREAKKVGSTVELITNGTLLTPELSSQLIKAGLDTLWVSLDGATPESYTDVRLGAALPKVLNNLTEFQNVRRTRYRLEPFNLQLNASILNLKAFDLEVKSVDLDLKPQLGIVFVAMKRNITDLPALLKIAKQLGALYFLVTNVFPYTPEMEKEILYSGSLTNSAYGSSRSRSFLDMPRMDINPSTKEAICQVLGGDHSLKMDGGNLGENNNRCPFLDKGAMAIRWDGDASPCLALLHDHKMYFYDYERSIKRHVVGSVLNQTVQQIWNQSEYLSFRKRLDEFNFSPCIYCGGCEFFESNQEDCHGSPIPACGGCLWAQGIVQCP
jgi:MoaA/NifB/PqqE/SkfB family radical SAM enzyme